MSQFPSQFPPQDPPPPPGPDAPPPLSPCPAALKVLAIIGIVLGSLEVVCYGCASAAPLIGRPQQQNPMAAGNKHPSYKAGALAFDAMSLFLSMVLLSGSIGALSLKRWARPMLRGYSIVAIIITALSIVVGFVYIWPAMEHMGAGPERGFALSGFLAGMCVTVLLSIYPIILLIYLRRPEIIAAFERGRAGGYPPVQYP